MVGWHHQLSEHEFEQTPGDSEGQGSLACYSPWGCKELDTTEQLNNNNRIAEKYKEEKCMAQTLFKKSFLRKPKHKRRNKVRHRKKF